MKAKITEEYELKIDLDELVSGMTTEEKRRMMRACATEDDIVDTVIAYICDEDTEGWWSSATKDLRQGLLERAERAQVKAALQYSWAPFDDMRKRLKEIRSEQHLYWFMHHDLPPDLEIAGRKILDKYRKNGGESHYTTEEADADVERALSILRDTLVKVAEKA